MTLHTKWFYDCKTVEERSERMKFVRANIEVINVINNILKRDLEALERKKVAPADYTSPSWAYQQADLNGSIRLLREYLNILDQEEIKRD